uniref:Uncharacterized protein n=1 Tax=Arundo donax TaxID=35708 RepID=A0A0A9BI05_ARUDO
MPPYVAEASCASAHANHSFRKSSIRSTTAGAGSAVGTVAPTASGAFAGSPPLSAAVCSSSHFSLAPSHSCHVTQPNHGRGARRGCRYRVTGSALGGWRSALGSKAACGGRRAASRGHHRGRW